MPSARFEEIVNFKNLRINSRQATTPYPKSGLFEGVPCVREEGNKTVSIIIDLPQIRTRPANAPNQFVGIVPALNDSFPLVTYGSRTGTFTEVNLPSAAKWQTNYGATAFSVSVAAIDKLAFSAAPVGTAAGNVLAAIVVQALDPAGNPVAARDIPVTLSLASGAGPLKGTVTRFTDAFPLILSEQFLPIAPGDQTYAFQWSALLNAHELFSVGWVTQIAPDRPPLANSISAPLRIGLNIQRWQDVLVLTWPAAKSATGLRLYTAEDLAGPWLPVTEVPRLRGERYEVLLPIDSRTVFFCLQR